MIKPKRNVAAWCLAATALGFGLTFGSLGVIAALAKMRADHAEYVENLDRAKNARVMMLQIERVRKSNGQPIEDCYTEGLRATCEIFKHGVKGVLVIDGGISPKAVSDKE